MNKWTEPTLGGPAAELIRLHVHYSWPGGWYGHLEVRMAGELDIARLITFTELSTEQLLVALGTAFSLVAALLGDD